MREELAGRGIDQDRIFVVPQIVDVDRFAPRPRNEELAARTGSRKTRGRHCQLADRLRGGRRSPSRGCHGTCRAAGDRGTDRRGRCLPASLEELTAELGIGDAVVFTGRVEQERVPEHYALLDLFAIPRGLEVCRAVTPLKPFEALSMEVPVLANDLPALAEIVSSSGGGRTVSPGSEEALPSDPRARGRPSARGLGRSGPRTRLAHHTPTRPSAAIRIPAGLLGQNDREAR